MHYWWLKVAFNLFSHSKWFPIFFFFGKSRYSFPKKWKRNHFWELCHLLIFLNFDVPNVSSFDGISTFSAFISASKDSIDSTVNSFMTSHGFQSLTDRRRCGPLAARLTGQRCRPDQSIAGVTDKVAVIAGHALNDICVNYVNVLQRFATNQESSSHIRHHWSEPSTADIWPEQNTGHHFQSSDQMTDKLVRSFHSIDSLNCRRTYRRTPEVRLRSCRPSFHWKAHPILDRMFEQTVR